MYTGGEPTLEELSNVIVDVQRSALDAELWPATLGGIIRLVGGLSATLWTVAAVAEFGSVREFARSGRLLAAVRPIPASTAAYACYYCTLDPLAAALRRVPAGSVLSGAMILEPGAFRRSEFYTDFARPNDLVDCAMLHDGEGSRRIVLGVGRSHRTGPFEASHRRTLGLLAPHLRQALQVTDLMTARQPRSGSDTLQMLSAHRRGVVILGRHRRVLFANAVAEALVREHEEVRIEGNRFTLLDPRSERALDAMLGKLPNTGGGVMTVIRQPGRLPIILNVASVPSHDDWTMPQAAEAIVFLSALEQAIGANTIQTLRSCFGLTEAEATAACAVLASPDMATAGRNLGIAVSTLRWHLRSIFGKTGVTRQMELALLIGQLGLLAESLTAV